MLIAPRRIILAAVVMFTELLTSRFGVCEVFLTSPLHLFVSCGEVCGEGRVIGERSNFFLLVYPRNIPLYFFHRVYFLVLISLPTPLQL